MSNTLLKSAIVALATTVIATGAMAQETKRGNGNGTRNASGQAAAGATGTRTGAGAGQQATKTATPQPAAQPAAPAPAPVASAPSSGWFGRGNTNTSGIDRTQAMQAHEIDRGVRNGSLTASEAAQLRAEQARIAEMERKAKADGNVTREERAQIRAAQRAAESHIWQESHDSERDGRARRHGAGRGWW